MTGLEKKMKIGILTFHRSRNYGAVLQAYGLTQTLKKIEKDTEIIDYVCTPIENTLHLWNISANMVRSVKQFIFRLQKKIAFDGFIKKRLPITQRKNITKSDLVKELNRYDYLIVGSDQIWNTKITDNDETYFLDVPGIKAKKIAYAGSAGDSISFESRELKRLKEFDKISVRETKLEEYLKVRGIESTVCCDPSLLLDASDYIKIQSRRLYKNKYIFLFMIWESDTLISLANKYAQEHGYVLISNKNCIDFFLHCKPEEFLSWIYHAECVLTNSFHGTVFALLYHKKFISDTRRPNGGVNERVQDILKTVNCSECILSDMNRKEGLQFHTVDFNKVDQSLEALRRKSLDWLFNLGLSDQWSV